MHREKDQPVVGSYVGGVDRLRIQKISVDIVYWSIIAVGKKGIWLGCVRIVHRIPSRVGKGMPDG